MSNDTDSTICDICHMLTPHIYGILKSDITKQNTQTLEQNIQVLFLEYILKKPPTSACVGGFSVVQYM